MIDSGLLNSTEAQIVVATDTSIALTDAFTAEVTVLDKSAEKLPQDSWGRLFGTDPGEVAINLFGADRTLKLGPSRLWIGY